MLTTDPLRKNYEFSRVYQRGRFISGRYVVLHYLKRRGSLKRLGVTASRKISGSVQRNRMKRLLRESYRLVERDVKQGYDMVLVGRDTHDAPGLGHVMPELLRLLKRAGLLEKLPDNEQADDLRGNLR